MKDFGFSLIDYIILIGYVLAVILAATFFAKGQKSLKDFFLASKNMPWMAVGASILASVLSAISIIGVTAEFWQYGPKITTSIVIPILLVPIVILLFVKAYKNLNVITAYEYLEKRFSLVIRLIASVLFMLFRSSYIGVVIFSSAIVLQEASGEDISIITLIVCIGLFCAVFTAVGGMKAIIWTEAVQLFVVYGGIAWMLYSILTNINGGFAGAWEIAVQNKHDYSFLKDPSYYSFDLFERTTFFGVMLGYIFTELATQGTDQITVQHYLTTTSLKNAAKSLITYGVLGIPVIGLLWIVGMSIFAFYHQNPGQLSAAVLADPNKLLPHYVATQLPHGLRGLFVAAIAAAILSVVIAGMGCLATATMNDFHLRIFKPNFTDSQHVFWARSWTIIWGVITTGLAVLICLLARENIVRTCLNTLGLFAGPLLAIFLLGLLLPRANSKGVFIGAILGLAIVLWINYGWVKLDPVTGKEIHISFIWPSFIGTTCTFIIGTLASLLFPPPAKEKTENLTYWDLRKKS